MPLIRNQRLRKRWRYVGAFGPELMVCAVRAEIGPVSQRFWAVWDRASGRSFGHTQLRPGSGELRFTADRVEIAHPGSEVEVSIELGASEPVESACVSGSSGWGWTRKRAGFPVTVVARIEGVERRVEARGVDDISAGYHARETAWHWSAGVGTAAGGEPVAWNLVSGINDPPRRSERAVWLGDPAAAVPREPEPVGFEDLEAVRFASGADLRFTAGPERRRSDSFGPIGSSYLHRFGLFTGAVDGVELSEGYGVMERLEARW